MKRLFILLVLIMTVSSCKNARITHELEIFVGTTITIPQVFDTIDIARDTLLQHNSQEQILSRMIVWYDTTACSSCNLKGIGMWNDIVKYSRDTVQGFEPVFIFSPNKENLNNFEIQTKITDFDFPILADYNNKFIEANPQIPRDRRYHVFLLDNNGKVVLVGNPMYNPRLWNLYKETINKLIDNGGTLPIE